MKRWLRNHLVSLGNEKEHNFFHDIIAVNSCMEPWHIEAQTQADRIIKQIKWPLFKPPAVMTIDDRSMTFNGVFPTLDAIASFKPWNKRSV